MRNFIHSKNAIYCSIAFVIFLVLFILLKLNLIYYLDSTIYGIISSIICTPLTVFFIFVTTLGGEYFLIIVTTFLLAFFRKRRFAFFISLNLLIAFLINFSLKLAISRSRPPIANMLQKASGYSFPSGHSMCSMAFFGSIFYFVYLYVKPSKLKKFILGTLPVLILLIGISRIYLGAHYFSDVLAGFSLGFAILCIFTYFYEKKYR